MRFVQKTFHGMRVDLAPAKEARHGATREVRLFYDDAAARAWASMQRQRGQRAKVGARVVRFDNVEILLWVVVVRGPREALDVVDVAPDAPAAAPPTTEA
jgi:hypothetical protein